MDEDEQPSPDELLEEQEDIERVERQVASSTSNVDEELRATRRADKAAYLQEKLAEQAANPDEDT